MPYVNTSPLQSFISKIDSHIIIVDFTSESDLSIYGLGQNFIRWKLTGVGTLVKIGLHTLIEDEEENTIQKNKTR